MCVFYIPYVVGVVNLFQCASLIELNACEDERFIAINFFQNKKRKAKNVAKEKKKKKWSNLWSMHQCLQIGCKLRFPRFF